MKNEEPDSLIIRPTDSPKTMDLKAYEAKRLQLPEETARAIRVRKALALELQSAAAAKAGNFEKATELLDEANRIREGK